MEKDVILNWKRRYNFRKWRCNNVVTYRWCTVCSNRCLRLSLVSVYWPTHCHSSLACRCLLIVYIWLIVLHLSTIKLCKSTHATTRTYFERRFMTHSHFDMGFSESTFSKYAFGRGSQKRVRCVRSWKWWQLWTTPYKIGLSLPCCYSN